MKVEKDPSDILKKIPRHEKAIYTEETPHKNLTSIERKELEFLLVLKSPIIENSKLNKKSNISLASLAT